MRWLRVAIIAICLSVASVAMGIGYVQAILKPVNLPVVVPSAVLAGVSSADAKQLRDFYGAMADVVVRDGLSPAPVVKTVFDLRNRHKDALQMAFANTGMVGKYPGLGERLDAYLLAAVGKTDAQLTGDIRRSAAKAFSEIK